MSSQSLSQFRLERRYRFRLYFFSGFMLFAIAVLITRLIELQLVNGASNRILAKKYVSRQEFTRAPRGLIFDRNYDRDGAESLLVKNINYIDFVIYPARFRRYRDGVEYVRRFCTVMGRPLENYAEELTKKNWHAMVRRNEALTLITRLTRREQERLMEIRVLSREGEFITNDLRYYTMGPALAHVTGYIGLPSRRELDKKKALPYQNIGKGGIEARYDRTLRGIDGIRIRHRIIDSEEQIAASEHGKNLVLTIDRRMQATAFRALKERKKRGAVVAIKAATGEVLTLVSYPSFDPNILSSGTRDRRQEHISEIKNYEAFLNIALQAKFPPASSFKPVVALAALEAKGKNPQGAETTFYCPGKWKLKSTLAGVPDSEYYCWEHAGHGRNNLMGAIAKSCNVYFYQLGYRIGPTGIINFARQFGLDSKTGIDLPGEISGFIPDQRWKQLRLSSRWYDGDTVNLSVGQGFVEITPIENAVFYAALVNHGRVFRPYLVREIRNPITNATIRHFYPQLVRKVDVAPEELAFIRQALRAVTTVGTAGYLRNRQPLIAGKTGTVQTRNKREGKDHAWFIGYAPYGDEENAVVVAVFIQNGMSGSGAAAPVAAEVLQAAFPGKTGDQKESAKESALVNPVQ